MMGKTKYDYSKAVVVDSKGRPVRLKCYMVRRTIYEYYQVEAATQKDALALPKEDPCAVRVKSETIVRWDDDNV